MQVTNEQLDKAAQAVWRATSDGLGLTWAWTDQAAVSRDFYRKLALAVVETLPDAQPDYCKKLEDLREWCSKRANASFMIHGEWPAARAFEETARHIGDVLFEAERGETEVA